MGTLFEFLRSLGAVRLGVMGVVFLAMALFFVFVTQRFTGTDMELLYSNLEPSDSNQILRQLESQSVPFRVDAEGAQIMVPTEDVARLRLMLAAEGLPGGSNVGYEIFDNVSAIGTTNFLQNINLIRALEGELARTIRSLKTIQAARVHLVLAKRELFSREKQTASASVVIKMRGAQRLGNEQIAAIQHLVAAGVPDLEPGKVSLIDDRGNLLARGDDQNSDQSRAGEFEDRRLAFQRRMAGEVAALLEKSVGRGNAKVTVNADLDYDRISTTEETFDPDGQVVRSTNSVEEQAQSRDTEGGDPVTVGTNLPDGAGADDSGQSSSNQESRTEETVNFEISKRIINHVREIGLIKRLSVAVLVDGIITFNDDGDPVYNERTKADMDNLAKLVSTAIGFNEGRGDTVEVINMRFAAIPIEPDVPLDLFFGLQKNDLLKIAEVVVLSILAILVILLVVRPLVSRAFEALPAAAAAAEQKLLEQQAAATAALAPPASAPGEAEEQFEELIDIDRVEGRVRASSVKKVGEIVEKHPEEALSIIRNWLYQEA
ncbi:MAG: flagellar M-ring protein FliF [Rhodospirillaceae bacterium]|nr:flagellar M-ring protein FliF [Rhodospirillaceae bacterium]MBT3884501.1 flagellar M-ring protein FliF [Rhodospirillaceae bacterium]MBT4119095.1 flagellar M-ring protein FliF [Rhodospirillaceae bacterium]MBT4674809.1 flagellar M-ring protein FliF [Rhodospirillaceae bacterium]MBT4719898.1 flagellar M-ring protein FliF [Rhodospirillaceae bacterium]